MICLPLIALTFREDNFVTVILLLPIAQVLSIFIHEFGHAFFGMLVGVELMQISIGRGRRFAAFWLGDVFIELRCLPISGYVRGVCLKESEWRLRMLLFLAGGLLCNAVLLGASGIFLIKTLPPGGSNQWPWITVCCAALGVANVFILIENSIPRRTNTTLMGGKTDGLQMLTLFKRPVPDLVVRRQHRAIGLASLLCGSNRTSEAHTVITNEIDYQGEDILLLSCLGYVEIKRREFLVALAIFQQVVLRSSFDPRRYSTALNNLAWAELLSADAARLASADMHSAEAVRLLPTAPTIRGTRGSVLVLRGEIDAGLALLKQALMGAATDASRCSAAAFIALVYHRRGDERAANQWITKATRLDPRNEVLPYVLSRMQPEATNAKVVIPAS